MGSSMTGAERIEISIGDITRLSVAALVNAANTTLLGGGGVDGAIHRAAGPRLLAHNRTLGGVRIGGAVMTPAFDLEAQGVRALIHTAGPVWGSDPDASGDEPLGYRLEDNQLAECYQNCLQVAREHNLRALAFPAISTGVYGFPKERAVKIAVGHIRRAIELDEFFLGIVFSCFSEEDAALYGRELGQQFRDYSLRVSLT